jgi:hypothetical protein
MTRTHVAEVRILEMSFVVMMGSFFDRGGWRVTSGSTASIPLKLCKYNKVIIQSTLTEIVQLGRRK